MAASGLLDAQGRPLSYKTPSVLPSYQIGADAPPVQLDPISAYNYLYKRRQTLIDSVNQRPLLRLWDRNMNPIGTIGKEQSVMVEEVMADSGSGNCVIRQDNWLSNFILYDRRAEEDLHFTLDPIPTKRSWRTRWGGKITNIHAKRDNTGLHTVEMEMVHNREHVKHLLAGANPVLPPEVQYPQMFLLPWNCRTALFIAGSINLARQYEPFLAIPDNIANPFGWVESLNSGPSFDINPLSWPIQFAFVNTLVDQSRTEVFASKWNDFHSASMPSLQDAGVIMRAYTFLTEDEESPHPELAELMGNFTEELIRPTRNCIILALEDKSGVTGPTGTLLDGPINLIASVADNGITDTLIPDPATAELLGLADTQSPTGITPIISQWFDVAPKPPWVIFKDNDYSGIIESNRSQHGATAKTAMTGSHSPGWVNDLQTWGIRYALAEISAVAFGGEQVPGSPGLDNIYNGEFDNSLLAYQRFTDPVRSIYMGDFGFLEHFESGSGTAYVISGEIALRTGLWKSRAFTSFSTSIRNGAPYLYDYDFTLGDRLGFTMAHAIYVDQCSAARRSYDLNKPMTLELVIGSGVLDTDPLSMATHALANVWNLFGAFMGSSDLF